MKPFTTSIFDFHYRFQVFVDADYNFDFGFCENRFKK